MEGNPLNLLNYPGWGYATLTREGPHRLPRRRVGFALFLEIGICLMISSD
jgi:hypothetical protein